MNDTDPTVKPTKRRAARNGAPAPVEPSEAAAAGTPVADAADAADGPSLRDVPASVHRAAGRLTDTVNNLQDAHKRSHLDDVHRIGGEFVAAAQALVAELVSDLTTSTGVTP